MSGLEPTIICPKCKVEIRFTESLAVPTKRCREFNPDYAVHPGAILEETLEVRGLTKKDTASRCGISVKHLNQILHGKAPVMPDLAISLERVLGVAADLWTNLQCQYDLHQTRVGTCRVPYAPYRLAIWASLSEGIFPPQSFRIWISAASAA